jgi:hypothetical protein
MAGCGRRGHRCTLIDIINQQKPIAILLLKKPRQFAVGAFFQRDLAAMVLVHFITIANIEAAHGRVKPATLHAIKQLYQQLGVVFSIGTDGAVRIEIGLKVIEFMAKQPNVSIKDNS